MIIKIKTQVVCDNFMSTETLTQCIYAEPEDEDVDRARDILLEPAREELDKGEHQDLFFFIGADVSRGRSL